MKCYLIMILISCVRLLVCAQSEDKLSNEGTFEVGDKAPPLKALKWIKGSPVWKFEEGHVYIVEFGATWCGPCRAAMPHLTQLLKDYSETVSVLSFFIWENGLGEPKDTISTYYVSRVEGYVEKMGDKMAYSVAIDDPQQTMARLWMKASGQSGIPTAFVVDRRGTIAWIGALGYDLMELEKVVDQVVKEKFNPESALKRQIVRNSVYERIIMAKHEGNYEAALILTDSLINEYPQNQSFYTLKFDILLSKNENEAYFFGWQILGNQLKDAESSLMSVAWYMINKRESLKSPDWDLTIAVCNRAFELTSYAITKSQILRAKAIVYFKKGDLKKAEELIQNAKGYLDKFDRNDVNDNYNGLENTMKLIQGKADQ